KNLFKNCQESFPKSCRHTFYLPKEAAIKFIFASNCVTDHTREPAAQPPDASCTETNAETALSSQRTQGLPTRSAAGFLRKSKLFS
ncbi:MAG: hypothetical protein LBN33_07480, partial [Desulfovibrio sp.]|nr:hypothetical protein [Desulfovibrio sp.]